MIDLKERFNSFVEKYTDEHGEAPSETVLKYGRHFMRAGQQFYSMGRMDGENNKRLSDDVLIQWAERIFPGEPDLTRDLAELMRECYSEGWKDGGGVTAQ